jgi:hypothetical protein
MLVADLLHEQKYSLQANRKTKEGSSHPGRNAQFEYINAKATEFLKGGRPAISVDTKKKEQVGDYKNGGREWRPRGQPENVQVHDFGKQKDVPYGVYDLGQNAGWVSVGTDHDTSAFAVESIRRWWSMMGREAYPKPRQRTPMKRTVLPQGRQAPDRLIEANVHSQEMFVYFQFHASGPPCQREAVPTIQDRRIVD